MNIQPYQQRNPKTNVEPIKTGKYEWNFFMRKKCSAVKADKKNTNDAILTIIYSNAWSNLGCLEKLTFGYGPIA